MKSPKGGWNARGWERTCRSSRRPMVSTIMNGSTRSILEPVKSRDRRSQRRRRNNRRDRCRRETAHRRRLWRRAPISLDHSRMGRKVQGQGQARLHRSSLQHGANVRALRRRGGALDLAHNRYFSRPATFDHERAQRRKTPPHLCPPWSTTDTAPGFPRTSSHCRGNRAPR